MAEERGLKKERHIVSWTQQEDDTLREQIGIHGTENWAIIASNFKDKTTRQCRRRWYTYLNSDFKRGGWSPEEDLLLCEAQKIFGNRWTEIAKVVSGRTDNAVKNRFTTLCKKRARYEALAKDNAALYINQNNKRCIGRKGYKTDGMSNVSVPMKKMRRSHVPASTENCNYGDNGMINPRPPFAVLVQNSPKVNNLEIISDGTSIYKDDPKVLQDFLSRSKEDDIFRYRISSTESIDLQLEDLKDLVEDLRSSSDGSLQSRRQPDLSDESPCSSEYSKGSNLLPHNTGSRTNQTLDECRNRVFSGVTINQVEIYPSCDEQTSNNGVTSASSSNEFGSPLHITPVFRSFAAGVPSPKFSESERNFLLKTFGVESPSPNPIMNHSQPPPCKRALLKSL